MTATRTENIAGNGGWADWWKRQGVFAVMLAAFAVAYWQGIALPNQRLQERLVDAQVEATRENSKAYTKLASDVSEMRKEHLEQLQRMDAQLGVLKRIAECVQPPRK